MRNFEKAEQSAKGSLRETSRSLRAAFAAAFALRPSLFVVVACALAIALTQGIPVMHSTVFYTAVAAFFFLLLGCVLYTKKGVIEATVTFAVGMFTAFTVPWTHSYFIVFVTAILIFVVLIILFSSIKLAAAVQATMTMAANLYYRDHQHNLQELKAVYASGTPGETLTSVDRANAILFFAQRKLPADIMNNLIRKVFQICTVTQIDQAKIETLLYKIYQATAEPREDLDTHISLVENYLLEGPGSPEELVESFIHTSFFVKDRNMHFNAYMATLYRGIERGYDGERLYQYMEQFQQIGTPA